MATIPLVIDAVLIERTILGRLSEGDIDGVAQILPDITAHQLYLLRHGLAKLTG